MKLIFFAHGKIIFFYDVHKGGQAQYFFNPPLDESSNDIFAMENYVEQKNEALTNLRQALTNLKNDVTTSVSVKRKR